mgnify:CR=1 FL=1
MSNVNADMVGMDYLESTPRKLVTVYLPLAVFLFVLLFPFYWMALTAIKQGDVNTGKQLLREAVETHPQHFETAARALAALEAYGANSEAFDGVSVIEAL